MFKSIWHYSLDGEQWLESWPNWLRWVVSIPFSYLGYSIFYWIINFNNFNIISEETFLGYLFMDFFSSIIPLFIFYHIIPRNKFIFSFAFAILLLFLHLILIALNILLILAGYSIFSDEVMSFIPSIITSVGIIFSAKIFINSKSNEQ
jgi:hypothetical protein